MDTITKTKSEGRVAAGKRLVEWNRKNKENLVKNREKVASSGDSSVSVSEQEPTSSNLSSPSQTSTVLYSGALAIVVVIGVALYVYRKKPAPPSNPAALQDPNRARGAARYFLHELAYINEFYKRNYGKSWFRSRLCYD